MTRYIKTLVLIALIFATNGLVVAQTSEQIYKAAGSPVNPKVAISWNRYNDHAGITDILKKIVKAYPGLAKLESIGKSFEGRDLWCIAITDYSKGDAAKKPGMYIDGNIHSNETQGSEFAMYTAWYLTENFNDNKFIRELLSDKIFYIIPTINPDARDSFLKIPTIQIRPVPELCR